MKNPFAGIIKMFQPRYAVVVNMYHVFPGRPVQKHAHREDFDRGEIDKASMFYQKVIRRHTELGFPNTEIQLIKGKKTVVQTRNYGPVDMVKGMNVQSA
ncbi:MAG: hypothetical protein ACI83W_001058 [Marinoscillum sp.]|jgi:hypothetical protein